METRCRFSLCPAALAHHHHFHHHHHHHHHRCPIICPQHGHHYHYHCQHRNITTAAAFPPAVAAGEATASEATNASSSFQEEADVDEILGADAEVYDDDDDDPVFVLTDEWKEFFAASEARRRLEKQQRQSKKNTKR